MKVGEHLVQGEDRDDRQRGQIPAPARSHQPGQGGRHQPGQGDAEQHLQHGGDDRD
jgi:hypothetical protein